MSATDGSVTAFSIAFRNLELNYRSWILESKKKESENPLQRQKTHTRLCASSFRFDRSFLYFCFARMFVCRFFSTSSSSLCFPHTSNDHECVCTPLEWKMKTNRLFAQHWLTVEVLLFLRGLDVCPRCDRMSQRFAAMRADVSSVDDVCMFYLATSVGTWESPIRCRRAVIRLQSIIDAKKKRFSDCFFFSPESINICR